MNVYDFDKTIYPGDSATHFFFYCLRRFPAARKALPGVLGALLRFALGRTDRGGLKAACFAVLRYVPSLPETVRDFWDVRMARIYPWYRDRAREDDVIISASPDFLVGEACRRLGVLCIATQMDKRSGVLLGPNCRGEEKPKRFRAALGEAWVEEFWSDSLSDRPMMELAEQGWLVRRGRPVRVITGRGKEQG